MVCHFPPAECPVMLVLVDSSIRHLAHVSLEVGTWLNRIEQPTDLCWQCPPGLMPFCPSIHHHGGPSCTKKSGM